MWWTDPEETAPVTAETDQRHVTDGPAFAIARAARFIARHAPGGIVEPISAGVTVVASTVPIAIMNGVQVTTAQPDSDALEQSVQRAATITVPWSMQVIGHPPSQAEYRLAEARSMHMTRLSTMTADLAIVAVDSALPVIEAQLRRVADESDRTGFLSVLGAVFGGNPAIGAPFVAPTMLAAEGARAYVAAVDGEVVSAGFTTLDDEGWLGLFAIGTLPAARRMGISRALTTLMLRDGRANGARTAVLQSSSMAAPLYAELGFADSNDDTLYFIDPS